MKKLFYVLIPFLSMAAHISVSAQTSPVSVFQYSVPLLNGTDTFNFNNYTGKKILIVNVASQCNNANQFTLLEQLYQHFKDSGLVILACPSNSFGFEPFAGSQLQNYYGANFPTSYKMSQKLVSRGTGVVSLFQWLTQKAMNGVSDVQIRSDFSKFLIDGQGKLVAYFDGEISPLDEKVFLAIRSH